MVRNSRLLAPSCGGWLETLGRDTYKAKYEAMRERAEKAEAVLAALKARIAESNVGIITKRVTYIESETETHDSVCIEGRVPFNDLEIAQSVRLVVEE